jgi:hypothetical protein
LLAGEIPTRFKYRGVAATGFGMTDAELLDSDDRALNQRVPLRYLKSSCAAPRRPVPGRRMSPPASPARRRYGKWDERKLKGRAKRLQWEARREGDSAAAAGAPAAGKKKSSEARSDTAASTKRVSEQRRDVYASLKGTKRKKQAGD